MYIEQLQIRYIQHQTLQYEKRTDMSAFVCKGTCGMHIDTEISGNIILPIPTMTGTPLFSNKAWNNDN